MFPQEIYCRPEILHTLLDVFGPYLLSHEIGLHYYDQLAIRCIAIEERLKYHLNRANRNIDTDIMMDKKSNSTSAAQSGSDVDRDNFLI